MSGEAEGSVTFSASVASEKCDPGLRKALAG